MNDAQSKPNTRIMFLVSMLAYILVGLWIARDSLNYFWNSDDLHLIRRFSSAELRGVWDGPWDPDQLESPGLRPLTTWFNHSRALVFGESPLAQRLFLIVLFAAYLTSLGRLVVRLGSPASIGALAGLLTLCAKYNYFHFVWISDGIHLFCGVLLVAAAHLLLDDLDRPSGWRLGGAVACGLAALLAREDSIALFPILLTLGGLYAFQHGRLRISFDRIWLSGKIMGVGAIGILLYGRVAVPLGPWPHGLKGFIGNAYSTISLTGTEGLTIPTLLFFGALIVLAMVRLPRNEQVKASVWLFCAIIACSPGIVTARVNLLLFPTSFFCIFAVLVLGGVFRRSDRLAAAFVTVVVLTISFVAVRESGIQQQSLHPMSLEQLERDWDMVYGLCAKCTIPQSRVDYLKRRMESAGVTRTLPDWNAWYAELRNQGRIGLGAETKGSVFIPPQPFLNQ